MKKNLVEVRTKTHIAHHILCCLQHEIAQTITHLTLLNEVAHVSFVRPHPDRLVGFVTSIHLDNKRMPQLFIYLSFSFKLGRLVKLLDRALVRPHEKSFRVVVNRTRIASLTKLPVETVASRLNISWCLGALLRWLHLFLASRFVR